MEWKEYQRKMLKHMRNKNKEVTVSLGRCEREIDALTRCQFKTYSQLQVTIFKLLKIINFKLLNILKSKLHYEEHKQPIRHMNDDA